MSMWIEMVMHMSGTRANGEKYPPGWTAFEVADWEGEHLIRGGMARQVPVPEWAVPKSPAPLKSAHAPRTVMPEPEPEQEPVPPDPEPLLASVVPLAPPAGLPPAPGDPKQAWVDYAVTQGMAPEDATRMTKADLQSRFGPRL
jgi:hypothetical protein